MARIKSRWLLGVILLSLVGLVVLPVMARGPSRQAGKSNIGHLYLVTKDHTDPNWPVIPGPWGKMKYTLSGPEFAFVFNGHGLDPNTDYTLIYYPDKEGNPWPREDIICLGSGTAGASGKLHIRDSVDTGDLPNPETDINEGAKIWLVLSEAIDCDEEMMFGWSPGEYLFEYDLITYSETE